MSVIHYFSPCIATFFDYDEVAFDTIIVASERPDKDNEKNYDQIKQDIIGEI